MSVRCLCSNVWCSSIDESYLHTHMTKSCVVQQVLVAFNGMPANKMLIYLDADAAHFVTWAAAAGDA